MKTLAPGFLLAMPQLGDPNFHRAVVLMLEHSEAGSMGIVINRATPLALGDLATGQGLPCAPARAKEPVFLGGPVEPQRGFVLHDDAEVAEKHTLLPGLYLSVTMDALTPLLSAPEARVRFCLGYAGWGPHQLEQEMAQGSWLFTEAARAPVLELSPDEVWDSLVRQMGVDPAMLVMGKGLN
ncbi:YqgE/AlgH family protein [Aggregicoccus sp. 17bor-14]|uniref:YqgE/AlgH family protein n=1 Tax=Myxococcaceae TaxID=31 RepID=UPI0012F1A8AD|nr:YqgE/AlgH family protein [Simulacricoccus sp. 17bor-14]MRI88548.1 YqgE/AlgH family protein [Aggregicoccus sp. 17bor-14]